MSELARNIRALWRRATRPRIIVVGGVRIAVSGPLPPYIRSSLYREKYESSEIALVEKYLRPGMRVLEIGAGIGLVGLVAARICGANNVTSYEANPLLSEIISTNYALNDEKPTLIMKAVTSDGQPLSFFRSTNIVSSSMYDRDCEGERTTVESDSLFSVLALYRPDIMVVDVEGAEVSLLDAPVLETITTIIIELHPHIVGAEKIDNVINNLLNNGFEMIENKAYTFVFWRKGNTVASI